MSAGNFDQDVKFHAERELSSVDTPQARRRAVMNRTAMIEAAAMMADDTLPLLADAVAVVLC